MQPPPQIPPQSSGPGAPPPYAPPNLAPRDGKKKPFSPLGLIVGIAVAVGVMTAIPRVINATRSSGVVVDGRSISESEARAGAKEMLEMARGAKAGDPTSLNFNTEPKTALGKRFKEIAVESAAIEKKYAETLGDGGVSDLIVPERLTSKAGRDKSRAELAEFRAASKTYFSGSAAVAEKLLALFDTDRARIAASANELRTDVAANSAGMMRLIDTAEKIIDFADGTKPSLQGSTVVFATSAGVDGYNKLVERFNTDAQSFTQTLQTSLTRRQERLNSASKRLDSGALD